MLHKHYLPISSRVLLSMVLRFIDFQMAENPTQTVLNIGEWKKKNVWFMYLESRERKEVLIFSTQIFKT